MGELSAMNYPVQVPPATQERRSLIAKTLLEGPKTIKELSIRFDCSYKAVSNDLDQLRKHGEACVTQTKKGRALLWHSVHHARAQLA
jgi:transposase